MNFIINLINLAAGVEGKYKNKIEKKSLFIFFFNFQKIGSGGSVKQKNKKTLAYVCS